MKSTYKLIGEYWDGRPRPEALPAAAPFDDSFLEAGSPDCLFDLYGKRRRVNLTDVLRAKSDADMAFIASSLCGADSVSVVMDYEPDHRLPVHERYYRRRAAEAVQALSALMPGANITTMAHPKAG